MTLYPGVKHKELTRPNDRVCHVSSKEDNHVKIGKYLEILVYSIIQWNSVQAYCRFALLLYHVHGLSVYRQYYFKEAMNMIVKIFLSQTKFVN